MRFTEHTDNAHGFFERTEGDAPSSVEVSINAKGAAQFSVKFYYLAPGEMESEIGGDLTGVVTRIRSTLAELGIPLAGEGGK